MKTKNPGIEGRYTNQRIKKKLLKEAFAAAVAAFINKIRNDQNEQRKGKFNSYKQGRAYFGYKPHNRINFLDIMVC